MSILNKAEAGEAITYQEAKELYAECDIGDLFQAARGIAGEEVTFYKNAFPPISITGTRCQLNCRHCSGHYLKHMIPAANEDRLIEICKSLNEKGVPGIVLSGGSRADGVVPLDDFAGAIKRIKEETDLALIAHTGPVNKRQAEILGRAGLDGVLTDIVGSASTSEKVFGIRITPEKYAETLRAIEKSGIPNISPHIIVGLDFGKIVGEIKALELLSNSHLSNIAIVVLIPTEGTPMGDISPPSPIEVGKIISIAQLMYPEVPVALGCVRPGKIYRGAIDEFALKAGARKLALPSTNARKTAKNLGLKVREFEQMCCAWM
jgi:hypothetical protein